MKNAHEGALEEPLAERLRRLTTALLRGMREPEGHDLDSVLLEARAAIAEAQALRGGGPGDFDIRR